MAKKVKVTKLKNVVKPLKSLALVREAETSKEAREKLIEKTIGHWKEKFEDRAPIVIENVAKILGAVQARMGAGQDPLSIAKGKEQQLIDVLAGAKALQAAGSGASMALKSYYQQAQAQKQGMSPEQAEVEAVAQAGRGTKAASDVAASIHAFQQAMQSGDTATMDQAKQQISQLFGFYQQLTAKIKAAQSGQGQGQPVQQSQPHAVARAVPAPAAGTPSGPRTPMQ